MSFIKKSFKFFCKFANLGIGMFEVCWVLPKYSGYRLWVWFRNVIGPIEIKHMVSGNQKGYTV
jgi:hypothetical protein